MTKIKRRFCDLVESYIPEYIRLEYPIFVEFVKSFVEYLDDSVFERVFHLTENNKIDTIFPELLDSFFDQYFRDVIDPNKYQLDENNKRFFLNFAKFIHDLKGKRTSFDYILTYLENFNASSDEYKDKFNIDKIEYEIEEPRRNYNALTYHYDGQLYHDYKQLYNFIKLYDKPFTYRIITDQPKHIIWNLIESINPVGFYPEYLYQQIFTDIINEFFEYFKIKLKYVFEDQLYKEIFYNGEYQYNSGSDSYNWYNGQWQHNRTRVYFKRQPEVPENVIYYKRQYFLDEFTSKIRTRFSDIYEEGNFYYGRDSYDHSNLYDGQRKITDQLVLKCKNIISDQFISEDEFTSKINTSFADSPKNQQYNDAITYGSENDLLFYRSDVKYQFKYDGSLKYGDPSSIQAKYYPNELFDLNYASYEKSDLYDFTLQTFLGGFVPLTWNMADPLTDQLMIERIVEAVSLHLGIPQIDIAPSGINSSTYVSIMQTVTQIYGTHFSFNERTMVGEIWGYDKLYSHDQMYNGQFLYNGVKTFAHFYDGNYINDDFKMLATQTSSFSEDLQIITGTEHLLNGRSTYEGIYFYNNILSVIDHVDVKTKLTYSENVSEPTDETDIQIRYRANISDSLNNSVQYNGAATYQSEFTNYSDVSHDEHDGSLLFGSVGIDYSPIFLYYDGSMTYSTSQLNYSSTENQYDEVNIVVRQNGIVIESTTL